MPNRLEELRKQRARLLEVLSWIEGQIIAESSAGGRPAGEPVAPSTRVASDPFAPIVPSPGPAEHEADIILEQYRDETKNLTESVRSGCFLYFALAMALLLAGVAVWYWLTVRRR
ncbi:MAG TPA: hypothetical protein VGM73_10925 [Candidatus Didemnitutus sp.]|jgi:hypothetical protein